MGHPLERRKDSGTGWRLKGSCDAGTTSITRSWELGEGGRVGIVSPQSVLEVTYPKVHTPWTLLTHPHGSRQELRSERQEPYGYGLGLELGWREASWPCLHVGGG